MAKKKKLDDLEDVSEASRERVVITTIYKLPYWLIIMVLGWIFIVYQMSNNEDYTNAFRQIRDGIPLTLWLAIASYVLALILGLITGVIRAYPPEPPETKLNFPQQVRSAISVAIYHVISVYIEFMRGIPPLVFLLIAGFIIVPAVRDPILDVMNATYVPIWNAIVPPIQNFLFNHDVVLGITVVDDTLWAGLFREYEGITNLTWRGRDPATAIAGLGLVYGAFLSEVFRAGIQSVGRGQVEAAKSLGMTYLQTMRFVVIPQAIRNILPPLGNNFISMIKDTSLVTILGTRDITQIARQWSGSEFTYIPTYSVLSMVYLTMTVTGSLMVQIMERQLRKFAKK